MPFGAGTRLLRSLFGVFLPGQEEAVGDEQTKRDKLWFERADAVILAPYSDDLATRLEQHAERLEYISDHPNDVSWLTFAIYYRKCFRDLAATLRKMKERV